MTDTVFRSPPSSSDAAMQNHSRERLTPREMCVLFSRVCTILPAFRWKIGVVFVGNVCIALMGALYFFPLKYAIDAINTKVPYAEFMPNTIWLMCAICLTHNFVGPLCLNLFVKRYVTPIAERTLGMWVLERVSENESLARANGEGRKLQPQVREGRERIITILETTPRELAYFARGAIIALYFLWTMFSVPAIAPVLIIGFGCYARSSYRTGILMAHTFSSKLRSKMDLETAESNELERLLCSPHVNIMRISRNITAAWDVYMKVSIQCETRWVIRQFLLQELSLFCTYLAMMVVLLWYVSLDTLSLGLALFYLDLIGKIAEPLGIFVQVQRRFLDAALMIERYVHIGGENPPSL
jgi:ABC-type multidrug transport system fused ATPase/permease subunit